MLDYDNDNDNDNGNDNDNDHECWSRLCYRIVSLVLDPFHRGRATEGGFPDAGIGLHRMPPGSDPTYSFFARDPGASDVRHLTRFTAPACRVFFARLQLAPHTHQVGIAAIDLCRMPRLRRLLQQRLTRLVQLVQQLASRRVAHVALYPG